MGWCRSSRLLQPVQIRIQGALSDLSLVSQHLLILNQFCPPLFFRSVGRCVSEDILPSTECRWSLVLSLLLGTSAMLVKETGITVFGVCVLYDALVLCRRPLVQ